MAFSSMFSAPASPIVADFGSSSLKLLQVTSGEKQLVAAAAEIPIPDDVRGQSADRRFEFLAQVMPGVLKDNGFKGKRVVCSPSSGHMLVQHMQAVGGDAPLEQFKLQLQQQLGVSPDGVIVRSVPVGELHRDGQAKQEHVVFAIARDDVMRYVDLFKRLRMQVVGVHNELQCLLFAFEHLNRRTEDAELTTLYVDLGWGSTKVAIAHGRDLVFAKNIAIGGRHFDQLVSQALKCDITAARARRIEQDLIPLRQAPAPTTAQKRQESLEAGGLAILRAGQAQAATDDRLASQLTDVHAAVAEERRTGQRPVEIGSRVPVAGGPAAQRPAVDFSELLEGLSDELSMCTRYHGAFFPSRSIDRVIFLGGEARQIGLCQHLAEALHCPATSGDPLARMLGPTPPAGLPEPNQPHPSWAVVCGLVSGPVDL